MRVTPNLQLREAVTLAFFNEDVIFETSFCNLPAEKYYFRNTVVKLTTLVPGVSFRLTSNQ